MNRDELKIVKELKSKINFLEIKMEMQRQESQRLTEVIKRMQDTIDKL